MTVDYFPLPVLDVDPEKGTAVVARCAAHLDKYYEIIDNDGTKRWGFYDGGAETPRDLLKLALSLDNIFCLCYEESNLSAPVGHIMLTRFNGYCAMVHYNVVRKHHFRAFEICASVLTKIFELCRLDGTPLVQTLVGLTPKSNRAARKLNEKLGFEEIGQLKRACHMKYWNKFDTGIITKREEKWVTKPLRQPQEQIQAHGQKLNASLS